MPDDYSALLLLPNFLLRDVFFTKCAVGDDFSQLVTVFRERLC
jgi:hypothetical protein